MAAAAPVEAQSLPDAPLSRGTLAFDADATLGAFTGVTSTMTGHLTGAGQLSGVRGWVETRTVSLTTSNGHRDRDMASSLEIPKYPTLRFDLDSVTPGSASGDSIPVTLHGRFTIHGQTRAARVPSLVWVWPKKSRVRGALPTKGKEYVLKMNEMITVRIDVEFGGN